MSCRTGRLAQFYSSVTLFCVLQNNMHISVLASLAGAVVWMGVLPSKLNPVIQPLMAAVKREQVMCVRTRR